MRLTIQLTSRDAFQLAFAFRGVLHKLDYLWKINYHVSTILCTTGDVRTRRNSFAQQPAKTHLRGVPINQKGFATNDELSTTTKPPLSINTTPPTYTMSHQFKPLTGTNVTVAMMTSGGLAPCLSASIALLTKYWVEAYRAGQITGLKFVMYRSGYKGLLTGDSFVLEESDWDKCGSLLYLGGSPIGNSRVKVC